jgi:hypothetical protein
LTGEYFWKLFVSGLSLGDRLEKGDIGVFVRFLVGGIDVSLVFQGSYDWDTGVHETATSHSFQQKRVAK